jgi:hypothetical protein
MDLEEKPEWIEDTEDYGPPAWLPICGLLVLFVAFGTCALLIAWGM